MMICEFEEDGIYPEIEPPYTVEDADSDIDEPRHGILLDGTEV